jgi:DNA-binding NtrC family response regulator
MSGLFQYDAGNLVVAVMTTASNGAWPEVCAKEIPNGKKPCVLIVDDDEMVLALMCRVLERAGCDVYACSNAADALDRLEMRTFDAVLLDVRMPGISGLELFSIIRERWPELAERTGFVTGNVPADEMRVLMRQFKRPFLLKPFGYDDLEHFARDLM